MLIVEQVVVGTHSETGHEFELPGVLVAVARAMGRLHAVVEALAS